MVYFIFLDKVGGGKWWNWRYTQVLICKLVFRVFASHKLFDLANQEEMWFQQERCQLKQWNGYKENLECCKRIPRIRMSKLVQVYTRWLRQLKENKIQVNNGKMLKKVGNIKKKLTVFLLPAPSVLSITTRLVRLSPPKLICFNCRWKYSILHPDW